MSGCGCGCGDGAKGPFSKGRDLVEFVWCAHGGAVRHQRIPDGGLKTTCQGCGAAFVLETYVGECPTCGGVHAVAPVNPFPEAVQYAGEGFEYPE